MITAKFGRDNRISVYGLTQWDYGQMLAVVADIAPPDGTEVQFYQGGLDSRGCLCGCTVRIPDRMLQDDETITAYIYVRSDTSGETILTAYLHVTARPRPTDYVMTDTEEYRRLLPTGGEPGQVPVRRDGADYSVGWGYRADGLHYADDHLQLMSGDVPIGDRIRIGSGSGREIELTNDGISIKWRYTDSNDWQVLAGLDSLKGLPGATPKLEIRDGNLYALWPD